MTSLLIKKFVWVIVFLYFVSIAQCAYALGNYKRLASALSHFMIGTIYETGGNNKLAIEEYKKTLAIDYHISTVHLNLAACYVKNSEINKAVEELGVVVNLEPEAIEPHAILGLLYSLQNEAKLANQEYEIALKNASKLEPENIEIYKSLGSIYLKQNKLKEAEAVYRLVLEISSDDADAHFALANIYYEQKDWLLAEKEAKSALSLNPDFVEALNFLGYLLVEQNKDLDQAESMLKKAVEKEPNNGAYLDSLGWLYFKKGKFKEALEKINEAASILDDPFILDHLAEVYLKTGNITKAKENWLKALKLDPAQKTIKEKIDKLK